MTILGIMLHIYLCSYINNNQAYDNVYIFSGYKTATSYLVHQVNTESFSFAISGKYFIGIYN